MTVLLRAPLRFAPETPLTASKNYLDLRHAATTALETAGHFDLESDLRIWVNGQPQPLDLHLERGDNAARIVAVLAQNTTK